MCMRILAWVQQQREWTGVVEWVKCGTLRWFGLVVRMNENEFVKRVYKSKIEGPSVRGRPPVKWINRVDDYWRDKVDR